MADGEKSESESSSGSSRSVAAKTNVTNTTTSLKDKPILLKGVNIPECNLCGVLASAPSPLVTAHENDQWGGLRPWGNYRAQPAATGYPGFKYPYGCLCRICMNVWQQTGALGTNQN
eukprot:586508-Amphidinium_carterae.1